MYIYAISIYIVFQNYQYNNVFVENQCVGTAEFNQAVEWFAANTTILCILYTSSLPGISRILCHHKLAITCLCLREAYFCCIAAAKIMFFSFLIQGIYAIPFVTLVLIGNEVLLNLKVENTFD